MSKHILVLGYYSHSSMGDECFKDAFWKLFGHQYHFTFADAPNASHKDIDALFIGGGSFLEFPITGIDERLFKSDIPVFYIGVDGTEIHPHHQALMKRAKLIALRSHRNFDIIKALNPNTITIPDLVYALYDPANVVPRTASMDKRILLLPNINVVPKYDSEHWKHTSWDHFKLEYAQLLDSLIADGYSLQYMPMSTDRRNLDDRAIIEIMSMMHSGHQIETVYRYHAPDIKDIIKLFGQYGTIISQRYHGLVLAEMAHRPFVSIAHHDKLISSEFNRGAFVSYYACSKATLHDALHFAQAQPCNVKLPISSHSYEALTRQVADHLR